MATSGLLLAATLLGVASCQARMPQSIPEPNMAQEFSAAPSRVGQPRMKPIVFEGRRYEQIMNGQVSGLAQRTGLMAIFEAENKTRLAVIKIYDEERDARVEADVQDVFFTRFELLPEQRSLLIENERHKRFLFNIDSQTVVPAD